MTIKRIMRFTVALTLFPLASCMTPEQMAARFIEYQDSLPPEDRHPRWKETKALMLRPAPQVGTDAPDFALSTKDDVETIQLSQFEGDRPVVLIFGSWT